MSRFGAFGKIPAAGDFVRFDLDPGFVDRWDRFVQNAMTHGRAQLGTRWQGCYFSAPIWRFTLPPGQAGRYGMLGIVMPSVDRVGREFPLTLAMSLLSPQPTIQLHLEARPVFEALEDVAFASLDDMPLAQLKQRLAALREPMPCSRLHRRALTAGLALSVAGAGDLTAMVAASSLGEGRDNPSAWSAQLASGSRLLIRESWPGEAEAAAFFDSDNALWRSGDAA